MAKKLKLKQRLTMRAHQEPIVLDVIKNFNSNKPYVLGSSPSSGKTEMSIETIIRLLETKQIETVLILAHSTNVLKMNFYERLLNYFHKEDGTVDVLTTKNGNAKRNYNYDAPIQVMIPQNINHIKKQFDLVIVDEAHHNVLAEEGNYSKIVEFVKPKFQLLLTGTPSKFILENDRAIIDNNEIPYNINCIGMDKIGMENFHDVRFDLIKSAYGFTTQDYNSTHNLAEDTKFSFKETEKTVNNVIFGAVKNIALRNGIDLSNNSNFALEGRKLIKGGKFGKTLIMCKSIKQAEQVSEIMGKSFNVEIKISNSENDTESKNLTAFKNDEFNFLCVVNRAREGYDDTSIRNLIDITLTHNVDLIYQMYCRIVRIDKTNSEPKLYLKVTSSGEGMPEYTMNIMTASLMLAVTENLEKFNGRNFRNIVMPRVERIEEDEEDGSPIVNTVVEVQNDNDDSRINRRLNELMVMDLVDVFSNDEKKLVKGNERYAVTTLGEAMDIITYPFDVYSIEECVELGKKYEITSGINWTNNYKTIEQGENIKLPSNPWNVFELEGGSAAFSKLLGSDKYDYDVSTIEECVELAQKYNIKSATNWVSNYKKISKKENLKLPSTPWNVFKLKIGEKGFSKLLGSDKYDYDISTIEECVILAQKYNIKSAGNWQIKYENIGKKENLKLPAMPWRVFKFGKHNEFTKLLGGNRYTYDVSTIEECVELGKKHNIISGSKWSKSYKDISEKEKMKLPREPWTAFKINGGSAAFSKLLGLKLVFYNVSTIEECVELARKYNVKSANRWSKNYKVIEIGENIKLPSNPWAAFKLKGGVGAFSKLLGSDKYDYDVLTIEECIKLGKKYNITSDSNWVSNYKKIGKKENLKLPATPWDTFKLIGGHTKFTKLLNEPKKSPSPKTLSKISKINQMGKTSSSKKMNKFFNDNPNEFKTYHKLRKEAMDYWKEAPFEEIAKLITNPEDKVIDFGCGGNDLKKQLPNNKVTPIDHIAIDDSVIACDMKDISEYVEDESHNTAVFSLALWGTLEDKQNYLKEAYRVLKQRGIIYIADTSKDDENNKLETKKQTLLDLLNNAGFQLIGDIDVREKFMYVSGIKI